jgi:hypothetical protein
MPAADFLMAAALAASPAATAEWTLVTENEVLRSAVETGTIRREGVMVTYWTERRFRKPQELGGRSFNISRHRSEANCQKSSTRVVEANFFMDDQAVLISLQPDSTPMHAEPGTVVAQEIALACRDPQAI